MRTLAAAVAFALVSIASGADCQPVRGAFVVLHDPPSLPDLKKARADGLNLLILQYTQGDSDYIDTAGARLFMHRADSAGIPYMIGLHYYENWEEEWRTGADPRRFVRSNLALVDTFRNRTTTGFKGWYVPMEIGNDPRDNYRALAAAFEPFRRLRADVALSIYFNPASGNVNAVRFARQVRRVLAPFDIVLLQDGVGVRNIVSSDYDRELHPYYRELKRAVIDNGGRFWAIVEGFKCVPLPGRECGAPETAAPAGRVCEQVAAVRRHTADIVAFDLMEQLEPLGTGDKKRVYDDFIETVNGRPCPT